MLNNVHHPNSVIPALRHHIYEYHYSFFNINFMDTQKDKAKTM